MQNLIFKGVILFYLIFVPLTLIPAQVTEDGGSKECEKALSLTMSQRYEEAIPIYKNIITTLKCQHCSPDKMAIWLKGLGTCELYTGNIGEAERLYLEALHCLNTPEYTNHKIVVCLGI